MKKSLNNVFDKKRLVTGDENLLNKNELLINKEDDKIVVKGRNTKGEIETLSGNTENTTPMIEYYLLVSKANVSPLIEKYEQKPFTSLFDFFYKDISLPNDLDLNNDRIIYTKKYPIENNEKIKISTGGTSVDHTITIDASIKEKGINSYLAPINHLASHISSIAYVDIRSTHLEQLNKLNVPAKRYIFNDVISEEGQDFNASRLISNIWFDAGENILYYYANGSKAFNLNITINKERADTLRYAIDKVNCSKVTVNNKVVYTKS